MLRWSYPFKAILLFYKIQKSKLKNSFFGYSIIRLIIQHGRPLMSYKCRRMKLDNKFTINSGITLMFVLLLVSLIHTPSARCILREVQAEDWQSYANFYYKLYCDFWNCTPEISGLFLFIPAAFSFRADMMRRIIICWRNMAHWYRDAPMDLVISPTSCGLSSQAISVL